MEQSSGSIGCGRGIYPGLEGQPLASAIFGDYTALVYLTPILGGIIADRWLGRTPTLIVGGVMMAHRPFPDGVRAAPSCSLCSR